MVAHATKFNKYKLNKPSSLPLYLEIRATDHPLEDANYPGERYHAQ